MTQCCAPVKVGARVGVAEREARCPGLTLPGPAPRFAPAATSFLSASKNPRSLMKNASEKHTVKLLTLAFSGLQADVRQAVCVFPSGNSESSEEKQGISHGAL